MLAVCICVCVFFFIHSSDESMAPNQYIYYAKTEVLQNKMVGAFWSLIELFDTNHEIILDNCSLTLQMVLCNVALCEIIEIFFFSVLPND